MKRESLSNQDYLMMMKVKNLDMKEQIEKYKELQTILKKYTYKNFPYTNDFKNEKSYVNKLADIYNELKNIETLQRVWSDI